MAEDATRLHAELKARPRTWLVQSDRGWWRQGAHGYTDDLAQAGHFTQAEAMRFADGDKIHAVPFTEVRGQILATMQRESVDFAARMSALTTILIKIEGN